LVNGQVKLSYLLLSFKLNIIKCNKSFIGWHLTTLIEGTYLLVHVNVKEAILYHIIFIIDVQNISIERLKFIFITKLINISLKNK